MDNYESVSKARLRAKLLNDAFADFEDEAKIYFVVLEARSGYSVWSVYNKESYPTFNDVDVIVRQTSIAYRKAKREAATE